MVGTRMRTVLGVRSSAKPSETKAGAIPSRRSAIGMSDELVSPYWLSGAAWTAFQLLLNLYNRSIECHRLLQIRCAHRNRAERNVVANERASKSRCTRVRCRAVYHAAIKEQHI